MSKFDLHVHTTYCDGKSTMEEMVVSAIEKNMECIGFSGHGYTYHDERYCMSEKETDEYCAEAERLKGVYKDRIKILCGVELDYYSTYPTDRFDYVIGSLHYVKFGDKYFPVDEKFEYLKQAAETYLDGDYYVLAEQYFDVVSGVAEKTGCDIIGHFNLVSKLNEKEHFIDTDNERYRKAWQKAALKLLESGKPFEINVGAMARGYTTEPYPSAEMRAFIKERGGKFILTGDCHHKDNLCKFFDRYEDLSDYKTIDDFLKEIKK